MDEYAETHGFVSFDSSTGFHMPDHDTPSADHALLRNERWALLSPEQKRKLPPVAPDVIVELCSENERGRTSIVTTCERRFDYGVRYVVSIDPFSQIVRAWGEPPAGFPDLSVILKL